MHYRILTALALFICAATAAPPTPAPKRYIATPGGDGFHATHLSSTTSGFSADSKGAHDWDVIDGFAGGFGDPQIQSIEEDGTVGVKFPVVQHNAPWHLVRLSAKTWPTNSTDYIYDSTAGSGATVYVISTGILVSHAEYLGFSSWGATFGGYPNIDGQGSGTHCAGLVNAETYGVAKRAKTVAVKVLSNSGSGSIQDIITGINWVVNKYRSNPRPSVIVLPIGGSPSAPLDHAVVAAYNAGIVVVTAAGSSNDNAGNFSPARVKQAITVGASTIADARASFSNYGPVVDIHAPGVNIISTWNDGGIKTISGTTTSTCIVAGLAAYIYGLYPSFTPGQVVAKINEWGLDGVLTGAPAGTPNKIAHIVS